MVFKVHNLTKTVFAGAFTGYILILSSIALMGIYQTYKFRDHIAIQKRNFLFYQFTNITAWLYVLSWCFDYVGFLIWNSNQTPLTVIIPSFTSVLFTISFQFRIWLYLYSIKVCIGSAEQKWHRYIDTSKSMASSMEMANNVNLKKKNETWWVRNHQKFGNSHYLFYKIALPIFCTVGLIVIAGIAGGVSHLVSLFLGAFFFFGIVSITSLWCAIPRKYSFYDKYRVKKECLIVTGISVGIILFNAVDVLFFSEIVSTPFDELSTNEFILEGCLRVFYSTAMSLFLYVQTYWVLGHFYLYYLCGCGDTNQHHAVMGSMGGGSILSGSSNLEKQLSGMIRVPTTDHHGLDGASGLGGGSSPDIPRARSLSNVVIATPIRLRHILKYRVTFNMYVQHAIFEFSLENILALIEFVQYRKHFAEIIGITGSLPRLPMELPLKDHAFPKSSLVYHSRRDRRRMTATANESGIEVSDMQMIRSIQGLIGKYIAQGSRFEVNVSFKTRSALLEIQDNLAIWMDVHEPLEKVTIFDGVIGTLWRLQKSDTFSRFEQSASFEKCQEFILETRARARAKRRADKLAAYEAEDGRDSKDPSYDPSGGSPLGTPRVASSGGGDRTPRGGVSFAIDAIKKGFSSKKLVLTKIGSTSNGIPTVSHQAAPSDTIGGGNENENDEESQTPRATRFESIEMTLPSEIPRNSSKLIDPAQLSPTFKATKGLAGNHSSSFEDAPDLEVIQSEVANQ